MLKKKDFLILVFFFFLFFILSYFRNPLIFSYRFNEKLIKDYLRSQDIEDKEDRIKDRIFLSDSDIYLASGVLYAKGESPTKFNFQHPPFLKYLFGYSVLIFGTPYPVQIFLSLFFIFLVYFLGILVFGNRLVSILSISFLILDSVFWETSHLTLLDLGQSTFALLFLILFFYFPKKSYLGGISLGFLFASKFWSLSLFFALFLVFYKFWFLKSKNFFKQTASVFLIGIFVFFLFYIVDFVSGKSIFDIFLLQLKTLKFMLFHNSTSIFGNLFLLFTSGYYLSWWEKGSWVKSDVWSFFWPFSFLLSILGAFKFSKNKKMLFIFIFPIFYFLFNFSNTAFTRYILFVLPFLYLSLSFFTLLIFKRLFSLR